MRPVRQELLLARHASEDASGGQEAVHSLWSRLFCGPLKMRRVPEKAVFGTEYLFRTVEACFLHRMLPKMRRVPQEPVLRTARTFRTIGGPLRYRMPTQRQVAAAAEPGEHFSRPLLCYRPRCSVDKPFTCTCGGGFIYKEKLSRYDRLGFSCVVPAGHDPATP